MARRRQTVQQIADAWQIACNPLRALTSIQIERMIEQARMGNDVMLQIAFAEMEKTMPIFGICIQKRLAGIVNRRWKIEPLDPKSSEAVSQARVIQKMFEEADFLNENGLTEALRHLGMSAFRGRSVVKAFVEDGKIHFRKLNNWNVIARGQKLWWCPDGQVDVLDTSSMTEIPPGEVICVKTDLPVDLPGMQIYLRQLVGEEQWARFVEKQGIPQVVITPPEGTPDDDLSKWTFKAMQLFEGGSGVLPAGSDLKILDGARGQDPFSKFCEHQMELVSILATGGTLATIGGSSGLGSNLADVQDQQFQSLINQDCKKIANSMTMSAVAKCARSLGQQLLCRFNFIEDSEYSTDEYIDMAKKLHDMGVPLDAKKMKQVLGIDFIADTASEVWTPSEEKMQLTVDDMQSSSEEENPDEEKS